MSEKVVKPGYKKTEVGVIPEDWGVVPLLACLLRTPEYGINAPSVEYDGSPPTYLRITDISDDNRFKPSPRVSVKHPSAESFYLSEGDLVFARTGASVGKSYLYNTNDGELVFAGYLIRVKINLTVLEPSFLSYYVQSKRYWDWVATMSIRSGQPGINGQEYGSLHIPLPPLPEQHAIAAALSDADGLIGALDALIEKERAIKQAAMQQLLTGRTRLPGFVGEWETKRLGDIITFLPTANNPRADLNDSGEIQYIHYGDVHAQAEPVLDCNVCALPYIDRGKIGNAAYLKDGDLIMVDASEDLEGTGKSVEIQGVIGKDVVAGLHTILCRGNPDQWARVYKAYLQFIPAFKLALTRIVTGISVYAISKKQFAEIELALPPLPEQRAIATVLSEMDAEITALEHRLEKARQIKQGMMQQLLTGKVRLVTPEVAG